MNVTLYRVCYEFTFNADPFELIPGRENGHCDVYVLRPETAVEMVSDVLDRHLDKGSYVITSVTDIFDEFTFNLENS